MWMFSLSLPSRKLTYRKFKKYRVDYDFDLENEWRGGHSINIFTNGNINTLDAAYTTTAAKHYTSSHFQTNNTIRPLVQLHQLKHPPQIIKEKANFNCKKMIPIKCSTWYSRMVIKIKTKKTFYLVSIYIYILTDGLNVLQEVSVGNDFVKRARSPCLHAFYAPLRIGLACVRVGLKRRPVACPQAIMQSRDPACLIMMKYSFESQSLHLFLPTPRGEPPRVFFNPTTTYSPFESRK